MKLCGGGRNGDDAIPPNSEMSNKVLLGPEESASTPSTTTLLEEASRSHPNAQRSVAAAVGTIPSGTFLAIADDDIPLEVTEKSSRLAPMAVLSQSILPLLVWSTVAAIAAVLYQWTRALPLWSAVAAVVSPPAPPPPRLALWSTVVAIVSPTPPPPPHGVMQQLYQWMNSLRSTLAAVVAAHPLLILTYCIVIIVGLMLLLLPSRTTSIPRRAHRARQASPCWIGGDSSILAAKRGERPSTGGGSGGGGGASSAVIPALLATGPAIFMMINKAPAPALMMSKLFLVSVLLASVAVVQAERVIYSPHKKADETAKEHAIDVARPSDHQMEETQKKEEETVGKLFRWKPRTQSITYVVCCDWCKYLMIYFPFFSRPFPRPILSELRYDWIRCDRSFH